VLHELAALLKSQVRQQVDLVARYGGEEFAVILPNTGVEGATTLGERLRSTIAKDGRPSDQVSALTDDGGAAADSGGALAVAERIRSSIAKETFGPSGASATITVSVGVASFPTHAASVDGLVEAADQSMYVAKARGKNCIAVALPLASA
jgi:GGDEF domain-containing protein